MKCRGGAAGACGVVARGVGDALFFRRRGPQHAVAVNVVSNGGAREIYRVDDNPPTLRALLPGCCRGDVLKHGNAVGYLHEHHFKLKNIMCAWLRVISIGATLRVIAHRVVRFEKKRRVSCRELLVSARLRKPPRVGCRKYRGSEL